MEQAELEAEAQGLSAPRLLQTLHVHGAREEVSCADVAGARLALGGGAGALRVWRWVAGAGWAEGLAAARAHRYGVTAARWAPGGTLLGSAGVDGAVRVWCVRRRDTEMRAARELAAPGAAAARALCWAGARLLVGHDDGAVCVWHATRGALLARLAAHAGALHALAAPAGGALLLAACTEGVLKVFDLHEVCEWGAAGGRASPAPLLWEDGAHDLGALCADCSDDGATTATGGHDGRVRLWRVQREGGTRRVRAAAALDGHAAAVTALRWARDVLASASLDRTSRLWRVREGSATCLCVLHAHARYLTCVALAADLRVLLTGSNDKTVRVWALGALELDDELEPPCDAAAHFGVGDLVGIAPLDDDLLLPDSAAEPGAGACLLWSSRAHHAGAVNCIATLGDLVVTACSDGAVRTFRWAAAQEALLAEHELSAGGYPALTCDVGASGELVLAGGLDGAARAWDAASGALLRSVAARAGDAGGGVRAARVSPHRPPLLLLATDDGVAPLWSLAQPDPEPLHVYGGHAEAALCCAWSACGRVCASGGAEGELRVHAAPPTPRTTHHEPDAHDLGVSCCDFAPGQRGGAALLATGGGDALIKLWRVDIDEESGDAALALVRALEAHGGGVACVRWGAPTGGALLASGGADRWARVWRVADGGARVEPAGAAPAEDAGGAVAVALLGGGVLALGTLAGELALWRLPELAATEGGSDSGGDEEGEDDGEEARWWGEVDVARWLRDHVTRVPGLEAGRAWEARLLACARTAGVTGARLLDEPLDELLEAFGCGKDAEAEVAQEEEVEGGEDDSTTSSAAVRARLLEELQWLRLGPAPAHLAWLAPHALLCPLTHRVLRVPARAADGVTYERLALHEWFAAEGAVSGLSGRRLRNAHVQPNHAARVVLRAFLAQHGHCPPP